MSYVFVPAVADAKVGDPVKTCPVSIPRGDDRGKVFTTTNLRTQDFRTLGDSRHLCGGAGPNRREGRSGPAS
ncbi:hypothetical protein MKK70_03280 [Methylobacterium sp. E-041]|uniref:hypothetical protein n=1 Tax=Methylobacterium sp. E-041 TaxID=2836573 RepID=UPI001FBC08BD|nr:hypothetical protein [Methylobacterium sp. E-041]MCJ2104423.1 hypothetical protein [Methylobacterium sp. E-041]